MNDYISRQAAIDALMPIYKSASLRNRNVFSTARKCMAAIEALPPAQPEPKEGEWVQIQRCARDAQPDLECPFCKHRIGWFDMGRYCAGCGAKLKGGAG